MIEHDFGASNKVSVCTALQEFPPLEFALAQLQATEDRESDARPVLGLNLNFSFVWITVANVSPPAVSSNLESSSKLFLHSATSVVLAAIETRIALVIVCSCIFSPFDNTK